MKIQIEKNDIKKAIYFISNLTQMQGNSPMQGALSSKRDFMGGIFDRWINIIPEGVVFNKEILPAISNGNNVEVITDYYDYNPKDVGIAPDVIGIRVNGKPVPFVQFNEKWETVPEMPQIELKTFKESQYMLSLRNQGYDEKYLVVVLSSFDVDYLIPLMDKELFDDSVYDALHMDDSVFIVNNHCGRICQTRKVDYSKTTIGTVELMCITTSKDFMETCDFCDKGISPEYFKSIEQCRSISTSYPSIPLSDLVSEKKKNLFKFTDTWYQNRGIERDGRITLDLTIDNINSIFIRKFNKSNVYLSVNSRCRVAGNQLSPGNYKLSFGILDRKGANHEEFFMNKDSINALQNREAELKKRFASIINENT